MSSPDAKTADALVLFGITGDLAFKKLFPALYNLTARGWDLPIIGVASSEWDTDQLRQRARDSLAAKVLAAMRKGFGGHAVKKAE